MAGFAVFMTILTFAFVGLVVVCVMSVALYVVAKRRVRSGVSSRKATFVGAAAPFLGLLWFVVACLIHVQLSRRREFSPPDVRLQISGLLAQQIEFLVGNEEAYVRAERQALSLL
jgi:hypothetical protein